MSGPQEDYDAKDAYGGGEPCRFEWLADSWRIASAISKFSCRVYNTVGQALSHWHLPRRDQHALCRIEGVSELQHHAGVHRRRRPAVSRFHQEAGQSSARHSPGRRGGLVVVGRNRCYCCDRDSSGAPLAPAAAESEDPGGIQRGRGETLARASTGQVSDSEGNRLPLES